MSRQPTQDEAKELKKATFDGDVIKIDKMINEDGINVNAVIWGNTALHYAVKFNQTNSVKKLVNLEANIDAPNEEDETPLQLARNSKDIHRDITDCLNEEDFRRKHN